MTEESNRAKFISLRNNVNVTGKGDKTMLFAHGYGCDQSMWRHITSAFSDSYRIILFDHVGSGKSDQTAYDYNKYDSLQGYADDVLEICEAFSLKRVTFVGHSVSAMVGLLAVIKNSSYFENLIMIGPSPHYINREDYYGGFNKDDINELLATVESNYLGWSRAITPVIMGVANPPELVDELTNVFCRNNPDLAKHFAKVTFLGDNRNDLKKLNLNTLILQCSDDTIAPLEVGRFVHNQIPGSRLEILKATGHCPHLSAPEETIQSMKRFLEHLNQ